MLLTWIYMVCHDMLKQVLYRIFKESWYVNKTTWHVKLK